jgi:hypothetical protein
MHFMNLAPVIFASTVEVADIRSEILEELIDGHFPAG